MAAELYTPGRFKLISVLGAVCALLLFGVGLRAAAGGLLLGTLIGLLNYGISYACLQRAAHKSSARSVVALWPVSSLRLICAMLALVAAAQYGPQFLLGTLGGILLELVTYHIDLVRLILAPYRGGRNAGEDGGTGSGTEPPH
jgi:hypothetical protein